MNPPEELAYTAYVIDAERHLLGILTLRDLILASPEERVGDIMSRDFVFVFTDDDQEKAAQIVQKYDLFSVPVVDREGRLVGAVTIDDVIDVMEAEATEDLHRLAAIVTTEDEYLRAPLGKKIKSRFLWLAILLIMGTFTSFVMQSFEGILQAAVALSFFIPMLTDTGGNVGSQSTAVVVRELALGRIEGPSLWKMIFSEALIGGILGILLGIVAVARVIFFKESLLLGLVLAISVWIIVFISNLVGVFLPVLFKKNETDPAIAATPVITTMSGHYKGFHVFRDSTENLTTVKRLKSFLNWCYNIDKGNDRTFCDKITKWRRSLFFQRLKEKGERFEDRNWF